MLNNSIHPSTLGGIKRLAKQIKKAKGVTYLKALDIAAQSASFQNYTHAHNQLSTSLKAPESGQQLFFTVYWYDRNDYSTGREVLEIKLSASLLKLLTKDELRKSNGLGRFRLASPDHLVNDDVGHSQSEARNTICKAARTLMFIEATGLKPSRDSDAAYPNGDYKNKLPKTDHSTDWYDPDTGQFILIDEPYLKPVVDGERAEWAKEHNWHLQASVWPGMYFPGETTMFVATDASTGYDFESLMAKIDSISTPLTAANWEGKSTRGHETFISPGAVTPQDKKRAISKGTISRVSSNKTAPMRSWDAPENERRPNAVMSIEFHLLAARLIKAVEQSSAKPVSVNTRLRSIKSKLEDWFFAEHDRKTTDQFDLFYYGAIDENDPFLAQAQSSSGVIDLLQELKDKLLDAYVDCEPLRKMIGKIDTSIKFTSKLLQYSA